MLDFGVVARPLRGPGDNGSRAKQLGKRPSGVVRVEEGSSQSSTEDVMSGRVGGGGAGRGAGVAA